MKGNWLQYKAGQDNSGSIASAWYQQLWNANEGVEGAKVAKNKYDPCPEGWRVPTIDEWRAIGADWAETYFIFDDENGRLTVPGKENVNNLLLPAVGSRLPETGNSNRLGSIGGYWLSSVPSNKLSKVSLVGFERTGVLYTAPSDRSLGLSVRCIQE